ncbi:Ion channel [Rhizoctonia solani]|uniref:Ion channel n=1 Tax=Rhizoctonia solani TaxID=456999 RepID=A0A8H7IJA0_9AGAM|nr:Ion channel [Rhizoctonia solani]
MTQSEAGPSTAPDIPLREMGGSPSNGTVSEQFVVEQERRTRRRRHPSGDIHIRAFVIHFFSTFLIAFSACVTTLETLPAFRSSSERVWFGIETALVALFTLEYGARCFAHSETWSQLWSWATSFFPILDLIAILPFYLLLILKFDMAFASVSTISIQQYHSAYDRGHVPSSQKIKRCSICIGVLRNDNVGGIFNPDRGTWDTTLEAFVNSDGDPTQFDSIPAAAWFVLVTITTVGYGDIIPRSFLGRLLSVPLLLFGLLLIALPSFVLGREFAAVWEYMGGNVLQGNDEAVAEARRHLNDTPLLSRTPLSRGRSASYVPLDDEVNISPNTSERRKDLTNLKLAQNQQALSKQIDQLAELIRIQAEELKMVKELLAKSSIDTLGG